jgi:drug/metabolite transporter (DMT)-like permease
MRGVAAVLGACLAGAGVAMIITGIGYTVGIGYLFVLAGLATMVVVHTDTD